MSSDCPFPCALNEQRRNLTLQKVKTLPLKIHLKWDRLVRFLKFGNTEWPTHLNALLLVPGRHAMPHEDHCLLILQRVIHQRRPRPSSGHARAPCVERTAWDLHSCRLSILCLLNASRAGLGLHMGSPTPLGPQCTHSASDSQKFLGWPE